MNLPLSTAFTVSHRFWVVVNYTLLKHEFYSMSITCPKNSKKERICKKTLLYKPKGLLAETPNRAVSSHPWRRF